MTSVHVHERRRYLKVWPFKARVGVSYSALLAVVAAAAIPAFQAFAQCEDQELLGEGVNTNRGAAYVLRKVGSQWVQWLKLVDSDSTIGRKFGDAVDIGGGVTVIGATGPPNSSSTGDQAPS